LNNFKKHLFAILISFICFSSIKSQSDFRSGYIIKNNGDSISGLIDFRSATSNATVCLFKNNDSSPQIEYTPTDIKMYRFTDSKYYVSKQVRTEQGDSSLFLEYLIKGIVDIYYYRDDLGNNHYLADKDKGRLLELKAGDYTLLIDGKTYIKNDKSYIGIIKYLFNEMPAIVEKSEEINLNHKNLIQLASDYHQQVCNDKSCIIYEKKLLKNRTTIGILTGFGGVLNFETKKEFHYELYFLKNASSSLTPNGSLGFYINSSAPSLNERFSFQYEGSLGVTNIQLTSTNFSSWRQIDYTEKIQFTKYGLLNSGLVMYKFPTGKFRPVFLAGVFANYYFINQYEHTLDSRLDFSSAYATFKENPIANLNVGTVLGVGLLKKTAKNKDVFLNLRWKLGFTDNSLNSPLVNFYFLSNELCFSAGFQL
jgi:hypothetical protein